MRLGKLQHIYDRHAKDFGLYGRKSAAQLEALRARIETHLHDAATEVVRGWYRGQEAALFYNPATQIVVVLDTHDEVVAAYRTSSAQAAHIQATGRLN